MPRLGELLVAAGLLSVGQVERALRAQVLWGGRLGTNLVELHLLELDGLSKALGRQHRLPPALARHFEKADPALQRMLPSELAEQLSCVPLLRMGPEQHVVIASTSPLGPRELALVAGELRVDVRRLIPAIAAELRIRYQLERVYGIRRTARFLRARGKSIPPFPAFEILPVQPEAELPTPSLPTATREIAVFQLPASPPPASRDEPSPPRRAARTGEPAVPDDRGEDLGGALDDLTRLATLGDDAGIPEAPIEDERTGRERRTYVRTLADEPALELDRLSLLARIALRKVPAGGAPPAAPGTSFAEATRAIRRSTGRDRVAELVVDALERFAPACEAAILLVIRGATAIGWRGFQRSGGVLGEIAVPMEHGGLVPRAVERNATLCGSSARLDEIDRLLLASLGRRDGALLIVPISVADQVMCVIAMATSDQAPAGNAELIAAAAGAAFARLMRDASR